MDPSTGEADEEGYEDEYQLEDSEVGYLWHIMSVVFGHWHAFLLLET